MFYLISLVAAIVLAIPTYGISLIVFFIVKRAIDKKAANMILHAVKQSLSVKNSIDLYHINEAAVRMVYRLFPADSDGCEIKKYPGSSLKTFSGNIRHPAYGSPIFLTVGKTGLGRITVHADNIHETANEYVQNLTDEIKSHMKSDKHGGQNA